MFVIIVVIRHVVVSKLSHQAISSSLCVLSNQLASYVQGRRQGDINRCRNPSRSGEVENEIRPALARRADKNNPLTKI